MPWRQLALGAGGAVVLMGAVAALVVPAVERGKRAGERRERAAREALIRREVARLREDQRPRYGGGAPAVRGTPRAIRRGRRALVRDLERAITRDVRRRVAAGLLEGAIRETECEPSSRVEPRLSIRKATYRCLAISGRSEGARGVPLTTGYPFIATIDYARGTFAWCKTNPRPGEGGTPLARVRLSPACAGRLDELF